MRDVLRLAVGADLEVFDAAGRTARARITACDRKRLVLEIGPVVCPPPTGPRLTLASAIPRASRADWMVEKLSELNTARFLPIVADRSVVVPHGRTRAMRWRRLAAESARQCRRAGVMSVEDPVPFSALIGALQAALSKTPPAAGLSDDLAARPLFSADSPPVGAWFLSTDPTARPLIDALADGILDRAGETVLIVGPEGDFSPAELDSLNRAGLTGLSLGTTILRTETAAVAAAAVFNAMACRCRGKDRS